MYTGDLVWVLELASPASCKTPATTIDSIPTKLTKKKQKIKQKKDQTPNKLHCTGLAYIHRTQG